MGFRGMFWCIAMQTLAAEVSHEEMGGQWFCSLVLRILRVFYLGDQQPVFPFCPLTLPSPTNTHLYTQPMHIVCSMALWT